MHYVYSSCTVYARISSYFSKNLFSLIQDGWSLLHVLAKSGEDYITLYSEQLQEIGYYTDDQETQCRNTERHRSDDHIQAKIRTTYGVKTHTLPEVSQATDSSYKTPPHPPWAWASEPSQERLHRARMAIVYMLCDAGVDVNGQDASGLTPLHYAARRGQLSPILFYILVVKKFDERHQNSSSSSSFYGHPVLSSLPYTGTPLFEISDAPMYLHSLISCFLLQSSWISFTVRSLS